MLDKLYRERDSIFSCALDELYELGKNNFCFAEPKDSKKLKKQMLVQGNIIQDFLRERCIFQKEEKIYTKDLYAAFQEYCEQNLLECRYTTTKFSQALAIRSDVEQKKMRIRGGKALSGVRGIRLKTEKEQRNEEDKDQDSDLSYENIRREEFTGTTEQWNKGGNNEEERK